MGRSANRGKGEILPFLCPSPCGAGMEGDVTLERWEGGIMEATEEFNSMGDADVLAWKSTNPECLGGNKWL